MDCRDGCDGCDGCDSRPALALALLTPHLTLSVVPSAVTGLYCTVSTYQSIK